MEKRESVFLFISLFIWVGIIAYISLTRNYFGYGTETDFLGGFIIEAQRLVSGQALTLEFHPPLYASVLALFQIVIDDWFLTGRILSLVSYTVALITSFFFFRLLVGNAAGWGALFSLMASSVMVFFSTLTTSDIFFYAIYTSTLLLATSAFKKKSLVLWAISGVLIALAILTRSNGFTLLALLFLPWIDTSTNQEKIRNTVVLFTGTLLPLLLWAAIANYSGSPFMPAGNHANLALTYFSPVNDRLSGDARMLVESQFHSLWQVISYDPLHMAKQYLGDLKELLMNIFFSDKLVRTPIFLFLIPGMVLLLIRQDRLTFFYLFILTFSQVLLVNLKYFEPRYHLYLVPLYGVALAICCEKMASLIKIKLKPEFANVTIAVAITALIALIPAAKNIIYVNSQAKFADIELHDSVNRTAGMTPKGAWIIARKPHMAYYNDGKYSILPNVKTYAELNDKLAEFARSAPVYVYFGQKEASTRPQFKELISANVEQIPWLLPKATSSTPDNWVLYEYKAR